MSVCAWPHAASQQSRALNTQYVLRHVVAVLILEESPSGSACRSSSSTSGRTTGSRDSGVGSKGSSSLSRSGTRGRTTLAVEAVVSEVEMSSVGVVAGDRPHAGGPLYAYEGLRIRCAKFRKAGPGFIRLVLGILLILLESVEGGFLGHLLDVLAAISKRHTIQGPGSSALCH